jgi:hypothetical protein
MHRLFRLTATILMGIIAFTPAIARAATLNYDVVVYGGTAGGAIAAIAAANEGQHVALIEPRHHIGGMTSGGLGRTDFGDMSVIGGMSLEFYKRLGKHYDEDVSWFFEPHRAEKTLRDWLKEAGVALYFDSRLKSLTKDGTRIASITLLNGDVFAASVFIDCSYEGDILPRAGITYTWGREGKAVYGESLAGRIAYSDKHQFDVPVNPHDEEGELLPLIMPDDGLAAGAGDKKVQAYNFRMCLSSDKDNQVPFPKPDNYDPKRWEIMRRYLAQHPDIKLDEVMIVSPMPNNKTDINNRGPVSTDYIGGSWLYPEASYEEQARIWQEHIDYVKGFFYFLANDPDVPAPLQAEMNGWGLAKDEFVDTDHWPHQLYVREARRMVGSYVTIQKDLQDDLRKEDSIGMGSYNSDSHHVQRFVVDESPLWEKGTPSLINEGDMQVGVRAYDMSYFSFVPKAEECTNLLVGSAFSASHVAYSSMRMEPQYMIIGEAAGIAASLAIQAKTPVQKIDIKALQAKLYEHDGILHREDTKPPYARAQDLPGVALDTDEAALNGDWHSSRNSAPYVGYEYLHESNQNNPENRVRYTPNLPQAGWYEIRLSYSAHPNRAKKAKIVIGTAAGTETVFIDQRKKQGALSPFVSLGTFALKQGKDSFVEIRGSVDAGGFLVADAVQWLKVKK